MTLNGWAAIRGITPNGWTAIAGMVTAVATWVLVVGTLLAGRWQVKQQRDAVRLQVREQHETNAVTILVRLTETWDSERMRKNRENLKFHLQQNSLVAPIKVGKLMGPVAN